MSLTRSKAPWEVAVQKTAALYGPKYVDNLSSSGVSSKGNVKVLTSNIVNTFELN